MRDRFTTMICYLKHAISNYSVKKQFFQDEAETAFEITTMKAKQRKKLTRAILPSLENAI